jgi:antitoxin component YwqK of YwqJK toxin-antitoxin module
MDNFCYICYEKQTKKDKFVKPDICKCKNLRIHESCFLKLQNQNMCSVCKKYYKNVYIKKDKQILNILDNGYYEKYMVNRKNKLSGLYTSHYPNDQILDLICYKNGKKDGLFRSYYENGNIKKSGIFKNDVLDGSYYTYYSEGTPKEYMHYKDGILNGIYIKKYKNGNIMIFTHYKNNNLHGNFAYIYQNGDMSINANYENGLLHGRFRAWKPNYKLIQDIIYNQGEFVKEIENSEYYIELPTKTQIRNLFLFLSGLSLLFYGILS